MHSVTTVHGLALLLALTGCVSFSTSALTRYDDNSFTGDSNGETNIFGGTRPYKGVPVTLELTTHLDVFIDQTVMITESGDLARVKPSRAIRTDHVKTKKIFLVDIKRPASGSLDSTINFNGNQYFDNITAATVDTTITDSAALLETIISKLPVAAKPTGADGSPSQGDPLGQRQHTFTPRTSTIAYRRFDINSPGFEQDLQAFVDQHLNDAIY
jgi:hypothetical protein